MLIKKNLLLIGLVIIIIILAGGWGIWQYRQYQAEEKMRYCEKFSDCKWVENYGCVNLDFYYTQPTPPWSVPCSCNTKTHTCYEVPVVQ